MPKLFRVGMIGCGGIANRHATILQKLERAELAAFCDIAEDRARDFSKKYADGKPPVFAVFLPRNAPVGRAKAARAGPA